MKTSYNFHIYSIDLCPYSPYNVMSGNVTAHVRCERGARADKENDKDGKRNLWTIKITTTEETAPRSNLT